MPQKIPPLEPGRYYHIFNRGNNSENLFREKTNYEHFLQLYDRFISPIGYTYAWCLLKNHFHLLVEVKEMEEVKTLSELSHCQGLQPLTGQETNTPTVVNDPVGGKEWKTSINH